MIEYLIQAFEIIVDFCQQEITISGFTFTLWEGFILSVILPTAGWATGKLIFLDED